MMAEAAAKSETRPLFRQSRMMRKKSDKLTSFAFNFSSCLSRAFRKSELLGFHRSSPVDLVFVAASLSAAGRGTVSQTSIIHHLPALSMGTLQNTIPIIRKKFSQNSEPSPSQTKQKYSKFSVEVPLHLFAFPFLFIQLGFHLSSRKTLQQSFTIPWRLNSKITPLSFQ